MQVKDLDLLLALLESRKVSGRELALAAGWNSHTYLQRILRGTITTLTAPRAHAIAEYLGVPVDLLFLTRVTRNTGQTVHPNGSDTAGTAA